jgi:hypothetical protein
MTIQIFADNQELPVERIEFSDGASNIKVTFGKMVAWSSNTVLLMSVVG